MRIKIACGRVRYVPVLNERPLLPGRRQLREATAKHNHRTEQLGQILPQGIGALAEQVDALRSIGVHPVDYLVTPRVIAMLIAMHKDEQQDVLRIAETRGATRNKNLGAYRKVLAQARSAGYAINAGQVVPGLTSIAVAVVDTQGQPFAAIGVVGPDTVLRGAKIERMVEVLRHEAQQISEDHAELIGELRP